MTDKRIFVEKKQGFDVFADSIFNDLKANLKINNLESVRYFICYDIQGISKSTFQDSLNTVFYDPNQEYIYFEQLPEMDYNHIFSWEFQSGQYDQREDRAVQCLKVISPDEPAIVSCSKVLALFGDITQNELSQIKSYLVNPTDSQFIGLEKPKTLDVSMPDPEKVAIMDGFIDMTAAEASDLHQSMNMAMTLSDLLHVQNYFKNTEKRNPTITELRVIDTYWSDHCRHTTFLTHLEDIDIDDSRESAPIKRAFELYMSLRKDLYSDKPDKPVTLMDMATIPAKKLKAEGYLDDLDESDEINACSIVVDAKINNTTEKWLVMFKNETHNHPTEIEPFGGASTCLGGAIRDPLSGRSYVYQAMRITGCADPTIPIEQTLENKLPQRKITTDAAAGYSSYGNQIGVTSGHVTEIYHPGYVAKRMELGAVVGAAPFENVIRKQPQDGDAVILVGGRTGRDGCGGATGSSKVHTEESLHTCSAEVQKGNPLLERNLQRLFRDPKVSRMIKRCNDFGAGGVCVAIGESAPGIDIDLNKVPTKYPGLDGTELAISESQERMAVVVAAESVQEFIRLASEENLEAVQVARITSNNRLVMHFDGDTIVDISREFLDTNGVTQTASAAINAPKNIDKYFENPYFDTNAAVDWKGALLSTLKNLNVCSQKGLVECFDSTVGKATVNMPLGGKYQLTPAQAMTALLPVEHGSTSTATAMAWGFDPYLSEISPFHAAVYAVVESLAKLTCIGTDYSKARLTQQEFFERLHHQPHRWGKPVAAMLGSLYAQMKLLTPAIGGKDSMSGSYLDIDVPPTLVCFALTTVEADDIISPEFKKPGNKIYFIPLKTDADNLPVFEDVACKYSQIHQHIIDKKIASAMTVTHGGIIATISKMAFGNMLGAKISTDNINSLFTPQLGGIVIEASDCDIPDAIELGEVTSEQSIMVNQQSIALSECLSCWESTLEGVFPTKVEQSGPVKNVIYKQPVATLKKQHIAKPTVFIPLFPGTNCEYDAIRSFEKAGAKCEFFVVKNKNKSDIEYSLEQLQKNIKASNIILLSGGFNAGDQPDGSDKLIASFMRNPRISEAVNQLLSKRDGLILGLGSGFKALMNLGLIPSGCITDIDENSPAITTNLIGRHTSCIAQVRVASVHSPWFSNVSIGEVYNIPISTGEGRFVTTDEMFEKLAAAGQIATQFVDSAANASMDIAYNPTGSFMAVEGMFSPDGRVFGRLGHSERVDTGLMRNVPGEYDMQIFRAGVDYFR